MKLENREETIKKIAAQLRQRLKAQGMKPSTKWIKQRAIAICESGESAGLEGTQILGEK